MLLSEGVGVRGVVAAPLARPPTHGCSRTAPPTSEAQQVGRMSVGQRVDDGSHRRTGARRTRSATEAVAGSTAATRANSAPPTIAAVPGVRRRRPALVCDPTASPSATHIGCFAKAT